MQKVFWRKTILVITALLSAMSFCFLNSIQSGVPYISKVFVYISVFFGMLFVFSFFKGKRDKWTVILSLVLSFLLLLGKYLVFADESNHTEFWLKMLITPVGSFLFFDRFLPYLFRWFDDCKKRVKSDRMSSKLLFFASFLFVLAAWIPAWIAEYPGIITPDTLNQLNQVHGIYPFTNANPFIHTMIINGLYNFVSLFTKESLNVYFWIGFIQMVFLSAVCAYAVVYVYKKSNSFVLALGSLLFFAFASFNVFYSVTISKDAVYAAFTLLFVIGIDKFGTNGNKENALVLIACGVMYCLMRENGFYSLPFTIAAFAVVTIGKNYKKMIVVLMIALLVASVIKYPIYSFAINHLNSSQSVKQTTIGSYIDLDDGLAKEDLVQIRYRRGEDTIMDRDYFRGNFLYVMAFQQVANVVVHDRPLTEKQEWMIEELIPISVIKRVYNPMLVDPIFQHASYYGTPKAIEIGAMEYIKLWADLLVKYPQDYVEAYVNMTKYYFYPNRYVNMYYIGVAENELGLKQKSLVSEEYKKNIEDFYYIQKDIPIVASIYSAGTSTFILLIAVAYALSRRNHISFLCLLPMLGNFLILMACVPINDEFRYSYPIVICLPFILVQTVFGEKDGAPEKAGGQTE